MLEWLSQTPYAVWVQQSWGWALALTFHAFGNAVIVGLIFIITLRLLGLFRTIPYASLKMLLPVIWIAVVVQALSGVTLWLTKPARYMTDGMFLWKLAFVVGGVIVTVYFEKILKREEGAWEAAKAVSTRGVQVVVAASFLWAAVLVMGRLTAYLGQLYRV